MIRAFLRDGVVYAIPSLVSRGLALFLVPIYTRVLSPEDYGSLDLLLVFASIVNLVLPLEVTQAVARYYTDEQDPERQRDYASSALWFTVGGYACFAATAWTFSETLAPWIMGRPGLLTSFRLGVGFMALQGVCYFLLSQLRYELRSGAHALTSLVLTLVTAVGGVLFAYALGWGLAGLILGMLLGVGAGCMCGFVALRDSLRPRVVGARLRELLAFSWWLVPSGLAVIVSAYVDRLMIKHFLSVEDVGIYGIGFRLASVVGLVMAGFQGALTPLIYTHHRDPDTPRQLARIFRAFAALALLAFVGLSVFAREALVLLTTPDYYAARSVVVYLVPAILCAQLYVFAPGPTIRKRTGIVAALGLAGALTNTGLNALLIPRHGIEGAALATLCGNAGVLVGFMAISQRLYPVPHRWGPLLAATALIGAWVGWVTTWDASLGVRVLAALPTPAVVLASGVVPRDELARILRWLRGARGSGEA
ncbi:MAG: oligosaccharide flippase family protein [Planctomycetota bacterium]